jgi:triosephosphate isomerase
MKLPSIIVNFKTYESATGQNALELAKIHEKVAKQENISIAVCVQLADLQKIAYEVEIPVFAQHIDPVNYGSNTGHVLPEAVKQANAFGTLLNHSENQISIETIQKSIKRAKEAGLYTILCADTPEKGREISEFNPDLIAVEPPELIGGDTSVSSAKPEVIKKSVELIGEGKLLVGAGVKNAQDVKTAIELGASGVLLASGVTKADNPEEVLVDLAKGLK